MPVPKGKGTLLAARVKRDKYVERRFDGVDKFTLMWELDLHPRTAERYERWFAAAKAERTGSGSPAEG